jgi:hypothetical protein
MSNLTVKGNDLGTGTIIFESPNTNTNRTITLPDATTTLVGTVATQTLTNKTLTTPFLSNVALVVPAETGEIEYNGTAPYFTPIGTQRGVLPAMQYYRLNANVVGANATSAQSLFGVGVTLASSTVYNFSSSFALSKLAGATSHLLSVLYGGTATFNNSFLHLVSAPNTTAAFSNLAAVGISNATAASGAIAIAGSTVTVTLNGTVSINAGGTFIPQYSLSAAPGGAYSTRIGSYFMIWPVGVAGTNTSVGAWA